MYRPLYKQASDRGNEGKFGHVRNSVLRSVSKVCDYARPAEQKRKKEVESSSVTAANAL